MYVPTPSPSICRVHFRHSKKVCCDPFFLLSCVLQKCCCFPFFVLPCLCALFLQSWDCLNKVYPVDRISSRWRPAVSWPQLDSHTHFLVILVFVEDWQVEQALQKQLSVNAHECGQQLATSLDSLDEEISKDKALSCRAVDLITCRNYIYTIVLVQEAAELQSFFF
jgi:hypothetical protein